MNGVSLKNNFTISFHFRRIEAAKEEILISDFYISLLEVFKQLLESVQEDRINEIVCYGLGHCSDCMITRYQCGLLLLLKDKFKAKTYVYDPVFYPVDCEILEHFGCEIIKENEEGKRKVLVQTLVYLPHCPKQLLNNFLWANWGISLKNSIIFANSISSLIESNPKRLLSESASYILRVSPYVSEFGVVNCFKYSDIFNDLALHVFPAKKLKLVPVDVWDLKPEPQYSEDETEFIVSKVTSVLRITQ